MKNRYLKITQITAFHISIFVTIFAMLHAALWKIEAGLIVFIFWAVSPYICVFIFDVIISKIAPKLKMDFVLCASSILMLCFTLFAYVGTLGDKSSTYALIFVFFPIYLHIGWIVILGGGLLWEVMPKATKGMKFD